MLLERWLERIGLWLSDKKLLLLNQFCLILSTIKLLRLARRIFRSFAFFPPYILIKTREGKNDHLFSSFLGPCTPFLSKREGKNRKETDPGSNPEEPKDFTSQMLMDSHLSPMSSPLPMQNQRPTEAAPDGHHHFREDIAFLLSRWNGLQMAVQNRWGGQDSLQKSKQLSSDIFSWFSESKGPLCVEDLENLLHESMLLSFNTEIEDGSIEQVAEQLMIMHEEYCHRDH